jgi:dihydroxyacetone kinase-like predicted kinase
MVGPEPVSVSELDPGTFPYDVVATVRGRERWSRLRGELAALGDSLVFAEDDECARIHLHTACPDRVVALLMDSGLVELRLEDMRMQVEARSAPSPQSPVAVVAVVPGEGWEEVLVSLGAAVVYGGPTMNPSASQLMEAVKEARGREVIVLPGHPNAWVVARQVASLSRVPVRVVPALSLPQALAAALAFNPDLNGAKNAAAMQEAAGRVKALQVTRAVRDATLGDVSVRRGDAVGFLEEDLVVAAPTCEEAVLALLERAVGPETTAVTLFYGKDVDGGRAGALAERVRSRYPQLLVEVHYGGQPLQDYVISVE